MQDSGFSIVLKQRWAFFETTGRGSTTRDQPHKYRFEEVTTHEFNLVYILHIYSLQHLGQFFNDMIKALDSLENVLWRRKLNTLPLDPYYTDPYWLNFMVIGEIKAGGKETGRKETGGKGVKKFCQKIFC